jgi:hypothetical protein
VTNSFDLILRDPERAKSHPNLCLRFSLDASAQDVALLSEWMTTVVGTPKPCTLLLHVHEKPRQHELCKRSHFSTTFHRLRLSSLIDEELRTASAYILLYCSPCCAESNSCRKHSGD